MSEKIANYQSSYQSSLSEKDLYEQLNFVLKETSFSNLGQRYVGKVRDSYLNGNVRYLVTSDRLSCFDVVVTTVPFKGQVLNQMAVEWLKRSETIISNHLIDVPHPNVMVAKNCDILPIEVVVRAYLTGSAWRDYQAGKLVSGIKLPTNMKKSEKFETPLLTPSTKAEKGKHDMPISEQEILATGIVPKKIWEEVHEKALNLFALGQEYLNQQGLILVDTKYEFGILDGKLVLADEMHTLDSSRFWIKDSYQEKFERGEDPDNLDKEPTRQWLLSQGYQGNGEIPTFTNEHRVAIAKHYISSYEKITGSIFNGRVADVNNELIEMIELNRRADF